MSGTRSEEATREARHRLAPAIAALLALACCALALSPEPPPDKLLAALIEYMGGHGPLLRALLDAAFALVLGGGAASLLVLLVDKVIRMLRDGREGPAVKPRPRRRSFLANILAYGILFAMLAFARRGGRGDEGASAAGSPAASAGPAILAPRARGGAGASAASEEEFEVPFLAIAALGALAAGGLVLALLVARRKGGSGYVPEPLPGPVDRLDEEEAALFAASRRSLEGGASIRESILACYAKMCELFARGGRLGSSPAAAASLTAREFAALLRSRGAGEPEIAALTSIFEKARYSNEECRESDRADAASALGAIELRYGRGEA